MRLIISMALSLIMCIDGISQVRVKGYYRKNGTYVQPHYRTKPDGNPYNNYSYPGNVNINTGKITPASQEITRTSKRSSPPPEVYKFRAYIKAHFNPPLRESASINSKEIYQCIIGEEVYVLDNTHDLYYKVDVNGNVGYLSRSFIEQNNQFNNNSYSENANINESKTKGLTILASDKTRSYLPPKEYKYKAVIKAHFNPPLRESASVTGKEIYQCVIGEDVYVLDDSNEIYYKVDVGGNIGYLSRSFIGQNEVKQTFETSVNASNTKVTNLVMVDYNATYIPLSDTYLYKTIISSMYEPPMRDTPYINGKVIYNCPLKATVFVLEKGPLYYKVNISGHIGYLSKSYLYEK